MVNRVFSLDTLSWLESTISLSSFQMHSSESQIKFATRRQITGVQLIQNIKVRSRL